MWRKKRNWVRLLIGGAVASAVLTSMLYGLVLSEMLSMELAIPWKFISKNRLMVDWAFLFLATFATALFINYFASRINTLKGMASGLLLSLLMITLCAFIDENVYGIGYHILCYLTWGCIFGIIVHKKKGLIIRQL